MSEIKYDEFLADVPAERRVEIEKVWQIVRASMPAGYTEVVDSKFLTFKADKEWYAALANKKNYISLHLTAMYVFPELKAKLDDSDKKVKSGKCCINFLKAGELPLEVIADIVSATDAESYLAQIKKIRNNG